MNQNSEMLQAAGFILMVRSPRPQFLLMQHLDRWDLPKGHAEGDEELLETALRETEEETGIPAHLIEVDPNFRFVTEYRVEGKKRGTYDKRVTYYLGYLQEKPEIKTTEHPGYRWWDWPAKGSIQERTIDPLLAELAAYFEKYPEQLEVR
ncbi:MAG: NUDIX domain-containing protein [Aureliella sp.]